MAVVSAAGPVGCLDLEEVNLEYSSGQKVPPSSLHLLTTPDSTMPDSGFNAFRVGTSENSPTSEDAPTKLGEEEIPISLLSEEKSSNGIANGAVQHNKGPTEVIPAENVISWLPHVPVKLRMGETDPLSLKPLSVPTMLQNTVRKAPNQIAMAVKQNGEWEKWTYSRYYDEVILAAKGFIHLGLKPYYAVGIIGFNRPEWFISDIAAIFAGGLAAGIYTTNSAEACHFVAENCKANILVVENDAQLQKVLSIWDRLPNLEAVVQYTGELKENYNGCYTWKSFLELGKEVPDVALQERLSNIAPNKCCTLIYTSGTTGNPKGVMLSHDNLTWTAAMAGRAAKLTYAQDVLISYLPLSHVAAQVVDVFAPILYGATVYFAQPDALKGSLVGTMKEVHPTAFLGVPRVWEKFQERIQEIGRQTTGMKKKVATWAKDIGLRGNLALMNGRANGKKRCCVNIESLEVCTSVPFGWTIANIAVFKKLRNALGLDRCKMCISAAAPIMRETLEFFLSLNIPVTEIYGMSESTGPHTVSFSWDFMLGSVGRELPGCTTKLDNPDAEGNGEICMNGRHVFMGYLNEEIKTKDTMDDEDFLRSGDVGRKDERGFLYITGRIKELLITAGGENVPPIPIEDNVKLELPVVSNCMLIGDKKKFLAMLITLKTEADPDTMIPKDKLTPLAIDWCRSVGSDATTLSGILETKKKKVPTATLR